MLVLKRPKNIAFVTGPTGIRRRAIGEFDETLIEKMKRNEENVDINDVDALELEVSNLLNNIDFDLSDDDDEEE